MRDPDVDEPRFLAAGHHLDREAQRGLRPPQEAGGVLRHTQRVGADGAHGALVEAAQPLAEALQAGQRPLLRVVVDALVLVQPRAQPHRLAQRIERIDLVADDARHLAVEAVGAEIDGGERWKVGHRS